MDVRNYLKFSFWKILLALLLLSLINIIMGVFIYPSAKAYVFLQVALNLFGSISVLSFIVLSLVLFSFFLISYLLSCYIIETKKWIKGIFLYVLVFVVFSILIINPLLQGYNALFDRCNHDSDCISYCGAVYSKNYVVMEDMFAMHDTCESPDTVPFMCEYNKCRRINFEKEVDSIQECDKFQDKNKRLCRSYFEYITQRNNR